MRKALANTDSQTEKMRLQALYEILSTEVSYIRDLTHVVKVLKCIYCIKTLLSGFLTIF